MNGVFKLSAAAIVCAMLSWSCTPVLTEEELRASQPAAAVAAPAQPKPAEAPPKQVKKSTARTVVEINDDPRRLLGLDTASLTRLLGAPGFTRRDPPAQLWRYRDDNCILDLFLYEAAKKKGGSTVRHFESRSLSKSNMTARTCLRALLLARRAPKAG